MEDAICKESKCKECGKVENDFNRRCDQHWVTEQADGCGLCGECAGTIPNWAGKCIVCGQSPILDCTDMCGPCTFGEAETAGGNW